MPAAHGTFRNLVSLQEYFERQDTQSRGGYAHIWALGRTVIMDRIPLGLTLTGRHATLTLFSSNCNKPSDGYKILPKIKQLKWLLL